MSARAIVIGAGPAGVHAALRLADFFPSVTLLECRARDQRRTVGEHLPPIALSQLSAMGLAPFLADQRHEFSPGVRCVWGDAQCIDREYFMTAPGRGVNLRRQIFDEQLMQAAEQRSVRLAFRSHLQAVVPTSQGYALTVQGPGGTEQLQAEVLIDASGRRAAATRRLGAVRRRYDELVGLQAVVRMARPTDEIGRVHIEAAEDGWWYGLPFSDGTLVASLMTDASVVRRHKQGAVGLWRDSLRQTQWLAPMAGEGLRLPRLQVFDAATQVVDYPASGNLLAVGDAAVAYDPLSSWGITKALCDARSAVEALIEERSGQGGAVSEYRKSQRTAFAAYWAQRSGFYQAETRWPAAPFWRARHQQNEQRAS